MYLLLTRLVSSILYACHIKKELNQRSIHKEMCVGMVRKESIWTNERTCFWGKRSYERGKKTASINNLRDRGYLPRSLLHLLKRGYVDLITIEQVMGTLYIHRSSKKKLYILQLLWERWVNESLFDINFCLDFSCIPIYQFQIPRFTCFLSKIYRFFSDLCGYFLISRLALQLKCERGKPPLSNT